MLSFFSLLKSTKLRSRWLPILVLALLSSACANLPKTLETVEVDLVEYPNLFGQRPEIVSQRNIYQLSPQQEVDFLNYLNQPANQEQSKNHVVSKYLKDFTKHFSYAGDTLIASQSMALKQGNCLSLAIVTTALANLAGVEVSYELVDSEPVFEFRGSIIQKGVHVRTRLWDDVNEVKPGTLPNDVAKLNPRSYLLVDYFPSKRTRFIRTLEPEEYISRYYLNIAAVAIADNDLNKAYWFSLESLKFQNNNSDALNMLAVLYRRSSQYAKAEEIYLHALNISEEKLSLLKNYALLLTAQQRFIEAAEIQAQLESLEDPSPFNWFFLARESYQNENYHEAIRFYKKAKEIAPYLHEVHLELAKSYYQVGMISRAEQSMKIALEHAQRRSTRSLYEAKLNSLSHSVNR